MNTFETVRDGILTWYQKNALKNPEYMQLTKNEKDILIIDLTFDHCLAQITVNEPSFVPYKYVYFEAGTIESQKAVESNQPEMIYLFYGREGMTIKEITDALDAAFQFCIAYVPQLIGTDERRF